MRTCGEDAAPTGVLWEEAHIMWKKQSQGQRIVCQRFVPLFQVSLSVAAPLMGLLLSLPASDSILSSCLVGVTQTQPPATPILKPVWVLLYPYFFCSLSTNLETPWGQARVLFIFVSWTQSRAFIKLQGTKESLSVMVNVVGMGSEWESSQLSQMNDKSCLL